MKKIITSLAVLSVFSVAYANTYTIYSKNSKDSKKIGELTEKNSTNYNPIFKKDNWVEIVNINSGKIGWVNNLEKNKLTEKQKEKIINELNSRTNYLLNQQQQFQKRFNNYMSDVNKQISQLQQISNNQFKNIKSEYSSISMATNADGKTFTVTEKCKDSEGNEKNITKTYPISKLGTFSLSNSNCN